MENQTRMRQIKFRGLRTDGKGWVYGDLKRVNDNRFGGQWTYIWVDTDETEDSGEEIQVEWQSVGQFTGLKDKNGAEIYEGDCIRHNDNIFVVKYSENQHVLLLRVENDKGMNWRSLQWLANVSKYCQVIGNIHTQDGGQEG